MRKRWRVGAARIALLFLVPATPPFTNQAHPSVGPVAHDDATLTVVTVPMVFPVLGHCSWSDSFLVPRANGRRRHLGQDVMAPKMRPLVAVFDGVVYPRYGSHNTLTLVGNSGWTAIYMHINNDTPGTDDGMGSGNYAFAPGIESGTSVRAGQKIAYVGDSGNAESTAPHLHFELHSSMGQEIINAAPSLKAAQRLAGAEPDLIVADAHPIVQAQPKPPTPPDKNGLAGGDILVCGKIVGIDATLSTLKLEVDLIILPGHQYVGITPTRRKTVKISSQTRVHRDFDENSRIVFSELTAGDRLEVTGANGGVGSVLAARDIGVLDDVE